MTAAQPVPITADNFTRAETDMYFGMFAGRGGFGKFFHRRRATARQYGRQAEPFAFGEESLDMGYEAGSPVTSDYGGNGDSHFSGEVNWVEFDTGIAADDHSHLISAEDRLRVAMAKQ